MKFHASIDIMPHKELLDPQGKTVLKNMYNIDINGIQDVRIGKHVDLTFDADNMSDAESRVEEACKKILANVIMEKYTYTISEIK